MILHCIPLCVLGLMTAPSTRATEPEPAAVSRMPDAARMRAVHELLASEPFVRYDRASFGGRQVDPRMVRVDGGDELELRIGGDGLAHRATHAPGRAEHPDASHQREVRRLRPAVAAAARGHPVPGAEAEEGVPAGQAEAVEPAAILHMQVKLSLEE